MSQNSTLAARNHYIDFLRGLSILVVMLGHLGYSGGSSQPLLIPHRWIEALAINSYLGVTVFFVISGYIITQTSLRRYQSFGQVKIGQFFVYRISRILPPLLLVVGLNLSLLYCHHPGFEIPAETNISVRKLLLSVFTFRFNLLYLNGGALLPAWAPLWSLAIEEVFYLCFPLASRLLRVKVLMLLLFGCVVVQGCFFRLKHGWGSLYLYQGCFDSLALGCAVATVSSATTSIKQLPWLARLARWVGLIAIIALYLGFDLRKNNAYVWLPLAVSLAAGVFLFGSRLTPNHPQSIWSFWTPYRIVGVAGFLSYELYIFHLPTLVLMRPVTAHIAQMTHQWLPQDLEFIVFAGALCAVCAAISRFYCEPVLRYIRSQAKG